MPAPWEMDWGGGQQAGPVYGPPPKAPAPPSAAEQQRVNIAQQNADLARQRFEYQQQRDADKDGQNPASGMTANQQRSAARVANLDSLVEQINRVQDLYNRNLRDEAIPLLSSLGEFLPTEDNRQFDAAAAGLAEQGLAAFRVPGVGAQSDTELRQFVQANKPTASDYDATIEEKLRQLRGRVDANRQSLGLAPAQWLGVDGAAPPAQDDRQPVASVTLDGGSAGPPANEPGAPQFGPGDPGYTPETGANRLVPDPETGAQVDAMLRSGTSLGDINRYLAERGDMPLRPADYARARQAISRGEPVNVTAQKYEPNSTFERAVTSLGDNALGAYAVGAGQFLSGNTLDNLAGDPERARLSQSISQAQSPTAYTIGELSGGVMAGLTGEAGLARLGMGAGLVRGAGADTLAGMANGAGMADDGNRLTGAMQGGLAAGVGSAAGGGAMRLAGRALNPTGGRLADLYAEGVRPTPGQRFADSGVIGRAVNATEEALQSVPIVGAAISGARQEARDQFQLGAFNQALREIGDGLPAGMKPGTDPNAYAQAAFNRVYDQARAGMSMVADAEFKNDLTALAPDIQTLGPQAQNRLRAIFQNSVNSKLQQGGLSGDAYKTAVADLGRHIGRFRKSAMGEDQALADILEGFRSAMDSAARRHSDPDAIALLDAADAGYAKLVRIEDAARRRGGDAGTFTPQNLDAAVQNTSGGVRSRAYLRGEAGMQGYATQGRALNDRLGNSGTTDRALAATTVAGGAAYVEPTTLAVLGAIGTAYAPGVRRVTKGVFAPSRGTRRAISQALRKIERLTAATSGAAGVLGTSPGQ